jgi:hypothetical protein
MTVSLTVLPFIEVDDIPFQRRSSNTAVDAVHRRASLVLQMADSLVTSNIRRQRELQRIESGRTDHVQQVIEDIMHEKPVNLIDLLRKTVPEALPSREEIKERYSSSNNKTSSKEKQKQRGRKIIGKVTSDDTEDNDNDGEDEGDNRSEDEEEEEDDSDAESVDRDKQFRKEQDIIVAESKVTSPLPGDIPLETLQAHTAPLQEQLKRSYAAIVKLRENSDLRYQALEKKYLELKRAQNHGEQIVETDAFGTAAVTATATTITSKEASEEVTLAYEAIICLRENSDLRYNVLESKYLDLKRSHAESDARNERLELEIETMREELLHLMNENQDGTMSAGSNDYKKRLSQIFLTSSTAAARRASSPTVLSSSILAFNGNSSSRKKAKEENSLLPKLKAQTRQHTDYRKHVREEKIRERTLRMAVLKEYVHLCNKVSDCSTCEDHVSQLALMNVKEQIQRIKSENAADKEAEALEDNITEGEKEADDEHSGDDKLIEDDKVDEDCGSSNGEDEADAIAESAKRHYGAMALLGANWEKLAEVDESKLDRTPRGRFASLSESKTEQKLRGKQSRFLAAESGTFAEWVCPNSSCAGGLPTCWQHRTIVGCYLRGIRLTKSIVLLRIKKCLGMYCRIDHDMQDLDQFGQTLPARPSASSQIRRNPPSARASATQAPPALKRPTSEVEVQRPPAVLNSFDSSALYSSSPTLKTIAVRPPKSALKNPFDLFPQHSGVSFSPSVDAPPPTSPTSVTVVSNCPTDTFAGVEGLPIEVNKTYHITKGPFVQADVDGLAGERTPQMSRKNNQMSQQEDPPQRNATQRPLPENAATGVESTMDKTPLLDTKIVVESPTSAAADDPTLRRPIALPLGEYKPALKGESPSSKFLAVHKNVSFSTITSTAQGDNRSRFNEPEEEGQKKTSAHPKEETLPLEDKKRVPTHLLAPTAPGEGISSEDSGSVKRGDCGNNRAFKGMEDDSSQRSNTSDRARRVSMAKLDPAERKEKQKAVLREAKLAAQNIRKQRRSSRTQPDGDDSSVISGVTNASSATNGSAKLRKEGFFKNPFKRKRKSNDVAPTRIGGIPLEFQGKNVVGAPTRLTMAGATEKTTSSRGSTPHATTEC